MRRSQLTFVFAWAVFAALVPGSCVADVVAADQSAFAPATVLRFTGPFINAQVLDLGAGVTYRNLSGGVADNFNLRADIGCPGMECLTYGLGAVPAVVWGADGKGDGYFGTSGSAESGGSSPSFEFAAAIDQFAFVGAEAVTALEQNDGHFGLLFFGPQGEQVGSASVSSTLTDPWSQFHGYRFSSPVTRVVLMGTGSVVLDNVSFSTASVPEPAAPLLIASALALAAALGRYKLLPEPTAI